MKKIINISLYTIIFLLVALICVLSIKKFFDNKQAKNLDNIIANNFVTGFVTFNKIKLPKEELIIPEIEIKIEENVSEPEKKDDNNSFIRDKESNNKVEEQKEFKEEVIVENQNEDSLILFDGLSESDLVIKLEKSLKNELSGTSSNFVKYYKDYGLDPYLAVAIILHETGCTWTCSSLVRECYNYGGMKGGNNKYKDTNYSCYASKEEGITAYLNMLYNNYYAKGLTTPELINPKYAMSLEWSVAINKYIDKIKNS